MAMRNFWVTAQVDGQTPKTVGGPMARDGGFVLTVRVRDKGESVVALQIEGRADHDGCLSLMVTDHGNGFNVTEDELGVMLRKVFRR